MAKQNKEEITIAYGETLHRTLRFVNVEAPIQAVVVIRNLFDVEVYQLAFDVEPDIYGNYEFEWGISASESMEKLKVGSYVWGVSVVIPQGVEDDTQQPLWRSPFIVRDVSVK